MKEKAFISIVIYAYNVQGKIRDYLIHIDQYLNSVFENYEILVVDDGSTDNTNTMVRQATNEINSTITLITLRWRHGADCAILSGIDLAIGDFIYEIEIDKTDYPFELLYTLYDEMKKGYDIVSATPYYVEN